MPPSTTTEAGVVQPPESRDWAWRWVPLGTAVKCCVPPKRRVAYVQVTDACGREESGGMRERQGVSAAGCGMRAVG